MFEFYFKWDGTKLEKKAEESHKPTWFLRITLVAVGKKTKTKETS